MGFLEFWGGTDVFAQMRSCIIEPELIVDIKNIPGIRESM